MKERMNEFEYPAFIDSHLHFLGLGQAAYIINLKHVTSIEEMLKILAKHRKESVIIGRGWDQNNFCDQRMPSIIDLNKISTTIPIILYRICGHIGVVNDKTLELVGNDYSIEGGSVDPETGIFKENALRLLAGFGQVPTRETIKKYLIKANEILLSQGITKVLSDDFIVFPINYEIIIDIINELYDANLLQVKIIEQVHLPKVEMLKEFIKKGYVNRDYGKWRLGPLKLLADGSLGARTASLNEPYSDDPTNKGIKTFSDEEMLELYNLANNASMDCHIHAIGDAAIDQVLEVMEKSLTMTGRNEHRHAIIHAQLATIKQIEKMKKLKFSAIIQPIFLESDIAMVASRLGQRQTEAYLFHTMFKEQVRIGFSTDCPVESSSPFQNIYAAMTRKSVKHSALGAYLPDEAQSIEECLKCYHEANLFLAYEEEIAFNDKIILDKDLRNSTPDDILKTKVKKTIIYNQVVYDFSKQKKGV